MRIILVHSRSVLAAHRPNIRLHAVASAEFQRLPLPGRCGIRCLCLTPEGAITDDDLRRICADPGRRTRAALLISQIAADGNRIAAALPAISNQPF